LSHLHAPGRGRKAREALCGAVTSVNSLGIKPVVALFAVERTQYTLRSDRSEVRHGEPHRSHYAVWCRTEAFREPLRHREEQSSLGTFLRWRISAMARRAKQKNFRCADSLTNPMSVPKDAQDAVHVGICARAASCSEQGNQFLMALGVDGLSDSGVGPMASFGLVCCRTSVRSASGRSD